MRKVQPVADALTRARRHRLDPSEGRAQGRAWELYGRVLVASEICGIPVRTSYGVP